MKAVIKVTLAGMIVATPAVAQPAESGSRVTAAVTVGTLGIGPELGLRFSDRFGARASASFFSLSQDFDSDDVEYDGKVKLRSYGLMADFYPGGGSFRISAGARINNSRARVTATPTTDTEIDGVVYTPAQIGTLTGRAETKNFAPALTVGWSGRNRRGFVFGGEAGALFQGAVRIRRFGATGTLASNPAFLADLEGERRELQDDVSKFKVYPIVQLSLGYRF